MAESSESLFKKLTRLFRSGPVIKRKIKDMKAPSVSSAKSVFARLPSNIYANALNAYGTYDRMARYSDFSEMEHEPLISAALDLYADESVSQDDKGQVLHIYSENQKIKEILEDLFYETINIDFNLTPWVRNLVKYGDFFLFNDVHPQYGVINLFPIPVNEIEREEGFDPNDPFAVRFRWATQGNTALQNWQVTHFRLMGNDSFLPYGTSVLDAARRVWRQLILIEDAMLVYRVVRSPERRVFYIDVGNVSPEDIPSFMEQAQATLKKSQVIDKTTGRVDLRYNPLSVDEDYFIPVRGGESGTKIDSLAGGTNVSAIEDVEYIQKKLFGALKVPKAYLGYDEALCLRNNTFVTLLDGREITISQLAEESQGNNDIWVMSADEVTGQMVPGRVAWCGPTKEVTQLTRITLDDGSAVECTGNHPFLTRDGSYINASDLHVDTSLRTINLRQSSKTDGDRLDDYTMVWHDGEWRYVHQLVNDWRCGGQHEVGRMRVVHHVNHDRHDNNPSNLQEMTWYGHRKHHSENVVTTLLRPDVMAKARVNRREKWLKTDRHRQFKSELMKRETMTPGTKLYGWIHGNEISAKMSKVMTERWEDPSYRKLKSVQNREIFDRPDVIEKISGDNHWHVRKCKDCTIEWLIDFCHKNHVTTINQFRCDHPKSVSLISPVGIRFVNKLVRTCGYRNWSDFSEKNITWNHKVVNVEVITLNEPEWVYDLRVETDVITGLHSSSYVENNRPSHSNFRLSNGVIVHNSSKATLAQEDIRFSRTISRIQRVILAELNKIAVIHLYCHGFDGDDLLDFNLRLSNPSTIAQQQKLELYRTQFEIIGAGLQAEGMFDRDFLRKTVMGLSEDQIDLIEKGKINDKRHDLVIEGMTDETAEDGGGGGMGGFGGGGGGGFGGGGGSIGGDIEDLGLGGDEESGGEEGGEEGGDEGSDEEGGEDKEPVEDDNAEEDNIFASSPRGAGKSLLTSGDDTEVESKLDGGVIDLPAGAPKKVGKDDDEELAIDTRKGLGKDIYNRGRRRTHGASKTHMPDFGSMVSYDRKALGPFDHNFFKGSPFKESVIDRKPIIDEGFKASQFGGLLRGLKKMKSLKETIELNRLNDDLDIDIDLEPVND